MGLLQFLPVLLVAAGVSAQYNPGTGSNGYVYGSGSSANGNVSLQSQSLSSFLNDLAQTNAQSQNTASGIQASISGSVSSGATSSPQGGFVNPVYQGNSNAGSGGSATTGNLNNNDVSYTNNTGGISGTGQSQISGSGTGLSLNSNANSAVSKNEFTTTTPYPYTCGSNCYGPYCYCERYGCVCAIAEGPVPASGNSKMSLISRKKSSANARIGFVRNAQHRQQLPKQILRQASRSKGTVNARTKH